MRCSYRIDVMLLHQHQILDHILHGNRLAGQRMRIMPIHTFELDGPTIEEKHAIPHHHAAKPDADRNLLSRFAHHQLI